MQIRLAPLCSSSEWSMAAQGCTWRSPSTAHTIRTGSGRTAGDKRKHLSVVAQALGSLEPIKEPDDRLHEQGQPRNPPIVESVGDRVLDHLHAGCRHSNHTLTQYDLKPGVFNLPPQALTGPPPQVYRIRV